MRGPGRNCYLFAIDVWLAVRLREVFMSSSPPQRTLRESLLAYVSEQDVLIS